MTTPHKALLIQARDALKEVYESGCESKLPRIGNAIAALTDAIDAPEPEPVAEVAGEWNAMHIKFLQAGVNLRLGDKLYTHPPAAREPLTKAEIDALWDGVLDDGDGIYEIRIAFSRAIEAAHGIGKPWTPADAAHRPGGLPMAFDNFDAEDDLK